MAIETTDNRKEYTGDGVSDTFSYPYYFLADGDLVVYVDGVLQTITTHYTVTGAGVPGGGSVVFVTPPASSTLVVIFRDPAITQSTDWLDGDADSADVKEQAFDRLTMIAQRLAERIDRSVTLQDGDATASMTIPALVDRLSQFLAFDASGNLIAASAVDSVLVSSFMQTVLDDTSAYAALSTLGVSGAVTTNFSSDADLTLTEAQYTAHTIVLTDTGTVLTAGRNVVLPTDVRSWVVDNQTAQDLTLKTSAGTGKTVVAGEIIVIRGDGTDIGYHFAGDAGFNDVTAVALALTGALSAASAHITGVLTHKPPTSAGTGAAYTATLGLSSLMTGMVYPVDLHTGNTSLTPTLDLDGLGAKTIKSKRGYSIEIGALQGIHFFEYDGTDFLAKDYEHYPVATVSNGSAQSVPNTTFTKKTFDTVDYDPEGLWVSASNHFVIPGDAIVEIIANNAWTSNTTGIRIQKMQLNSANVVGGGNQRVTASTGAAEANMSGRIKVSANDIIHIELYQNSGGSLNTAGTAELEWITIKVERWL